MWKGTNQNYYIVVKFFASVMIVGDFFQCVNTLSAVCVEVNMQHCFHKWVCCVFSTV